MTSDELNLSTDRGPLRAVALRHEHGSVPRVVGQARAWMAEQMLALAKHHGVAIRKDRDLVELLSHCEAGDQVPPELYAAVAQVLVWLYRCNADLAQRETAEGQPAG